jgi:uncharacterized repeat protein (TIGR01451 family)
MNGENIFCSRHFEQLNPAAHVGLLRRNRLLSQVLAAMALLAVSVALTSCSGGSIAFIPVITNATPNSVSAGGASFAVVITGSGFASAVVLVGGTPVTVTSVTSTTIGAMIPAGMIATPGTLTLVVVNVLPSGNVTSNSALITVTSSSELPVLAINKTHTGNFTQGQTGATFQVTVSNTGTGETGGQVTVTEAPPTGLTVTAMAGTGWTCITSCTRNDALAGGESYPPITVTVNVATNAPSSLTNQVEVSGGGSAPATGSDTVMIGAFGTPMLSIGATTSSPTFAPGGSGAYTITVSNTGNAATSGTVTVMATLDSSLSLGSMGISGTGWTCNPSTLTCTLNTPLAPGASANPITIQVIIATSAGASVKSTFTVAASGSTAMTTVTTPT